LARVRRRDNSLGIHISKAQAVLRPSDELELQASLSLSIFSMSVRVVARIRPLLKSENEIDTIVRTSGADETARPNVVKVPNPKNFSEEFSFQFNSVYGENATQQEIFDAEGEREGWSKSDNGIDNERQSHRRSSTYFSATMSLFLLMALPERGKHTQCAEASRSLIAA
jgi:hypothetical protein